MKSRQLAARIIALTRSVWARAGISVQLIALVVLCVLLTGGVGGLVSLARMQATLRAQAQNAELASADFVAANAAEYVDSAERSVASLASRPDVLSAIEHGDLELLQPELERWIQLNPAFEGVSVFDAAGVKRLGVVRDGSSSIQGNPTGRAWFDAAIAGGGPILGAPSLSPVTGRGVVPYAVPLSDSTGAIQSVLVAPISLSRLSDLVRTVRLGTDDRASLIDLNAGIILAHTKTARQLQPTSEQNQAIQHLRIGERGVADDVNGSGEQMLAGFAPVPGLPWGVLVQQPTREAFASIEQMTRNTIGFVVVFVALAASLGAIMAGRLIRPIERLQTSALAMAQGNLHRRTGLIRADELGELARAFDTMAEQLQQKVNQLEEQSTTLGEQAALLDFADDAILLWDIQSGAIRFWNCGAEHLYGWTKAEVLGRTPQAILRTQFPTPLSGINAELIRTGRWEGELVHIRRDGTPIIVASRWGMRDGAVLGINRDVTARKQAEAALAHQAQHDALTDLPNRAHFTECLERALAESRLTGCSVGVIYIDLDDFKLVNDNLGHDGGDALLIEVATRLRAVLRAGDLACRLGGDEFTVLLNGITDERSATSIAERLSETLHIPVRLGAGDVAVTASLGLALGAPGCVQPRDLMIRADMALYRAKAAGRSRWVLFDGDADAEPTDRHRRRQEMTAGSA